jgi:hypothetical protein
MFWHILLYCYFLPKADDLVSLVKTCYALVERRFCTLSRSSQACHILAWWEKQRTDGFVGNPLWGSLMAAAEMGDAPQMRLLFNSM